MTQQTLFLLDMGRIPCMGFELRQNLSGLETVNKFMKRMQSTTKEAKSAIRKVQEDMMCYYNQRRSLAPMFKPGGWIYLDASDIRTTCPSLKLLHRRLEPFEIECQVGLLAYHLKLPHGMRQLHLVFNGKVICCPRRSDTRKEATSPATTHCRWCRTRVGSRRDIR